MVVSVAKAAEERAITVTGNGEAKARPNRLEIELQASGVAELTGDAIIKYDDAIRRVTDAFEKLNIERLAIEPGDVSFGSTLANNVRVVRGAANQVKPQMAIIQSMRLTLRDIEQLPQKELVATVGKLIDTAQDAGATITNTPAGNVVINQNGQMIVQNQAARPVVAFVVNEVEPLHDQAYQKAFEDATTRAAKLAGLAHAELGEVISVDETSQVAYRPDGMIQQSLASIRLSEIPVRVSLRVRFELVKPPVRIEVSRD